MAVSIQPYRKLLARYLKSQRRLASLLAATALGRSVAIFADIVAYFNFRYTIEALLCRNLFERILERPGASAVPGSPGEAISRFREDVNEVAFFMAELLITLAFGLFAVVAVVVMTRASLSCWSLTISPAPWTWIRSACSGTVSLGTDRRPMTALPAWRFRTAARPCDVLTTSLS